MMKLMKIVESLKRVMGFEEKVNAFQHPPLSCSRLIFKLMLSFKNGGLLVNIFSQSVQEAKRSTSKHHACKEIATYGYISWFENKYLICYSHNRCSYISRRKIQHLCKWGRAFFYCNKNHKTVLNEIFL